MRTARLAAGCGLLALSLSLAGRTSLGQEAPRAATAPSLLPQWVATYAQDESLQITQEKGVFWLDYAMRLDGGGCGLPEVITAVFHLPQGFYGAEFTPRSWNTRVRLRLRPMKMPRNSAVLGRAETPNYAAAIASFSPLRWGGEVGRYEKRGEGGNLSLFALLPGAAAPRFQARRRMVGLSAESRGKRVRVEVRGGFALVDGRNDRAPAELEPYLQQRSDIAVVYRGPEGEAGGQVRGVRLNRDIVRVPLRRVPGRASGRTFAQAECIVGVNGHFDYDPESMAGSVGFRAPLRPVP